MLDEVKKLSAGLDREAVARAVCYWSEPSTCHDAYCSHKCAAVRPDEWCWKAADAILALAAPAEGYVIVSELPSLRVIERIMKVAAVSANGAYDIWTEVVSAACLPAAPTGGRS